MGLIKNHKVQHDAILSHLSQQSAGGGHVLITVVQEWTNQKRVPTSQIASPMFLRCAHAIQELDKEDPWLLGVWVQTKCKRYSLFKGLSDHLLWIQELQVFTGFGTPSLLPPPSIAHAQLSAAGHELPTSPLHVSSPWQPHAYPCGFFSCLLLTPIHGECCTCMYFIPVPVTCPSHCFLSPLQQSLF